MYNYSTPVTHSQDTKVTFRDAVQDKKKKNTHAIILQSLLDYTAATHHTDLLASHAHFFQNILAKHYFSKKQWYAADNVDKSNQSFF